MNRKYQPCALAIAVILSANVYAGNYGPWDNAVSAPGINTAAAEGCPIESPDGRHLVWASNRHGQVAGETNIFIADWVARP